MSINAGIPPMVKKIMPMSTIEFDVFLCTKKALFSGKEKQMISFTYILSSFSFLCLFRLPSFILPICPSIWQYIYTPWACLPRIA